jgi:hypothetical protein
MNLDALLQRLPPQPLTDLPFPPSLLGAFRRKSITFCTGVTDETTVVYWFQSRSFTIDLRLPDAAATPVTERQGWVGVTLWDGATSQLSWQIERSYQPCNQWPEPARLDFIGNCVLEYAPSGAYVEDWRQQSSRGPLLGLRLTGMVEEASGAELVLEGGLVIAGEHAAFARSRLPHVDDALQGADSLGAALASGVVTDAEIESYEVSIAIGGRAITHSTQSRRCGQTIEGAFTFRADGRVEQEAVMHGVAGTLLYEVDVFEPDFTFTTQTHSTPEARDWLERERDHLQRHALMAS